jgi:hypothetical protein
MGRCSLRKEASKKALKARFKRTARSTALNQDREKKQ